MIKNNTGSYTSTREDGTDNVNQSYKLENLPGNGKVITNYNDDVIAISKSKAKIILRDFKDNLAGAGSWKSAGGLFITFIATLVSASFNNYILSSESWRTLFGLGAALSFIWLAISTVNSFVKAKKRTVSSVIEDMENSSH